MCVIVFALLSKRRTALIHFATLSPKPHTKRNLMLPFVAVQFCVFFLLLLAHTALTTVWLIFAVLPSLCLLQVTYWTGPSVQAKRAHRLTIPRQQKMKHTIKTNCTRGKNETLCPSSRVTIVCACLTPSVDWIFAPTRAKKSFNNPPRTY